MASLDIILNVEGTSDINKLVDQINRLDAQTKKMYKAFAAGNLTMREAKASFQQVDGVTEELTDSMERLFDTMRRDAAIKKNIKGLNNLGVAIKRVAKRELELQKAAEERRKAEERREQKLDAAAEKARRRYDPIYGATKKLEEALADLDLAQTRQGMSAEVAAKQTEHLRKDYDKFVAAIKTGNMRLIDGGNQFAVFGNAAYQSQRKVQKFASSVGQQFGYQIQDFFVQIQSGTDILVALGQQGSQLLGIFGTKGALAGAVLAIGTMVAGIGAAAYKSMLGIKDFKDSLDELTETRDEVESFFDFLGQKPEEIADKFQMAIDKVIELRKTLLEDTMSSLQDKAAENLSSANKFLRTPVGLELLPSTIASSFGIKAGGSLRDRVGGRPYTDEQMSLLNQYREIAKEVLAAEDPLQRLSAFERLEQTLLDLGVSTENLPDDFKEVRSELAELALEYDQTATALDKVNARINGMDFKTGFARALEQGQIDIDELMPPVDTEGRATSRQDSLQKRFEQLGMQRQYMSRAFGSEIIKAAQAGFKFEMNGITETEKLRRKLQIENDGIRQKFYERRRVANRREAEEQAKLQRESFGNAQRSFDFMQSSYRNMSRAAGSPEIIRAQTEAQANREKLHNRDISLFTTQNQIRLKALKDISDAEIKESKRVEGVQNFISVTRVQQRRRILDTISAAEVKEAKRVANVETFIFASKNQQRVQLFKKATEDEQALIKERNAQILSAQRELDTYLPLSQLQMNAKKAQQDLVDGINAAMELKEELGEAAYEALRLAGFDMSKPISDATKEAAQLAEKLGISLQFAAKLVEISAMGPERAKFQAKIRAGLIPPQAQGDFDVEGGETPFALQQYIDFVDEKLNNKKTGKTDYQKLLEDHNKYIDDLQTEGRIQEQLVGYYGDERDIQEQLLKAREKYGALGELYDEAAIEAELRKQQAIKKTQQGLEKFNKFYEKSIELVDDMTDAFADVLADGTKTFKDFGKAIEDMFRRLLADLAAQALRNQILIPIATSFSSAMGSPAASAAMSAGGSTLGSTFGSAFGATAIGTAFKTGLTAFGAGASTAIGLGTTTTGATAMALSPTMATVGAVAPYLLAAVAVFELFNKKTKELDSGIRANVTSNNALIESYQKLKSSRFFGLITNTYEKESRVVGSALEEQIYFIQDSIRDMAGVLGVGSGAFQGFTHSFSVSLKGLSEERQMQVLTQELNKLGNAFAAMIPNISSLQELTKVLQERQQIELRILRAQGNTAAIREIELQGVHEYNRELMRQAYAAEDAKESMQKLTNSIQANAFATKVEYERAKARAAVGIATPANMPAAPAPAPAVAYSAPAASATPSQMSEEIDELRKDQNRHFELMTQALAKIVKNTKDNKNYLKNWDVIGLPAERTA